MAMIGSPLASWNGAALSAPTVAAAHLYPTAPLVSSFVIALDTWVLPPRPPPMPPP
jgi:hypothetical protein